jgi:hypothetical protein
MTPREGTSQLPTVRVPGGSVAGGRLPRGLVLPCAPLAVRPAQPRSCGITVTLVGLLKRRLPGGRRCP